MRVLRVLAGDTVSTVETRSTLLEAHGAIRRVRLVVPVGRALTVRRQVTVRRRIARQACRAAVARVAPEGALLAGESRSVFVQSIDARTVRRNCPVRVKCAGRATRDVEALVAL